MRGKRISLHPAQLIVFSFAIVITLGTVLLSLPAATRSGVRLSFIDALFTSVSATCVNGLVVVDTGGVFSTFGQIVILSCVQIGGLGLMTFTTVFLVLSGQRLGITDRMAIELSFHHTATGKIKPLIMHIVAMTFLIEAAGAVLLALYWSETKRFSSAGETIYYSVFHVISAYCNAGFVLFPDNLIGFQSDAFVELLIAALVILGGLGFLVSLDLREYLWQHLKRSWPRLSVRESDVPSRARPRLSLHTKLVLVTSGLLLLIGTVSFYFLERHNAFNDLGEGAAWLNSFFCSVTPRSGGFNTIAYSQLGGATLLCTMVLMFIGAAPGSTGGGIKTSSFGLLVAYSVSRWRGHKRLHLFRRTVPEESIDLAAGVVVAAVAMLIITSSVLMITETRGLTPVAGQQKLLPVIFETISAMSTVGLSLDLTPKLTDEGKLIVSLAMFVGRIGPFTLAIAAAGHRRRTETRYRYAEENVMVS